MFGSWQELSQYERASQAGVFNVAGYNADFEMDLSDF
jgi:hypothetical protein